jgi:hypothetical protein
MEEGGGKSYEWIKKRIAAWEARGKHELEDLAGYHVHLGVTEYVGPRPRYQPTWNGLIRILLSINDHTPTLEAVKSFQQAQLGRRNANHCLIELLPLPSPSMRNWMYGEHSTIPFLKTREVYREHLAPQRAQHIKARVEERKPAAVFFYGFGYHMWWKEIAGVQFSKTSIGKHPYYTGSNGQTLFVITKHPVSRRGLPNEYFHQIGREIAAKLPQP